MVIDLFDEKTWEEFRESGMLWATNTMLEHLFGWCIVYDYQSNSKLRVVPCTTKRNGIAEIAEKEGREKLIRYLKSKDRENGKTANDMKFYESTDGVQFCETTNEMKIYDLEKIGFYMNTEYFRHSIEVNGHNSKLIIAMEELAELSQAVSKVARYIEGDEIKLGADKCSLDADKILDNLAEEIADVLICIENLKIMCDVKSDDIQRWIYYKTARQVIKDRDSEDRNMTGKED